MSSHILTFSLKYALLSGLLEPLMYNDICLVLFPLFFKENGNL